MKYWLQQKMKSHATLLGTFTRGFNVFYPLIGGRGKECTLLIPDFQPKFSRKVKLGLIKSELALFWPWLSMILLNKCSVHFGSFFFHCT